MLVGDVEHSKKSDRGCHVDSTSADANAALARVGEVQSVEERISKGYVSVSEGHCHILIAHSNREPSCCTCSMKYRVASEEGQPNN